MPTSSTDQSLPMPPLVNVWLVTGNCSAIGGWFREQLLFESGTWYSSTIAPPMQWPADTWQLCVL